MKILFIISSLNTGGAERVLSTLANHWKKNGWDIDIFILQKQKPFYAINQSITFHYSSTYSKNTTINYLYHLYNIRKAIKLSKPDTIVSFLNVMNISTIIAAMGTSIPIIISERNNFDTLKSKFWQKLRRWTYPQTTGMVVQSNYDYDKYTYVKNKLIINNPLNKNQLLDVSFEEKEKIIIAVGSLNHQKGFDMLIKALSKINLKEWKIMIIGEGSKRSMLTQLIKQYQLEDSVSLIGRKSNIFDYYKKASIFVLSSRYEGFPNVLNEAMAHGCASIAFNCKTGPADMIAHKSNGLLVEAENINALSENIEILMNDQKMQENFFHESLKIREKNDLEKISKIWKEYIINVRNTYV